MQLRSSGTTRQQVSVLLFFSGSLRLILCRFFLRRRYRCPYYFAGRQCKIKLPGDCGALIILVFLVLPQRHALSANAVPARYRLYMYE